MADYIGAVPLTPGVNLPPERSGSGYRIACSAAGWFRLIMYDGSSYDVYANQGQGGEDGLKVIGVATAGNTPTPVGTGTVQVLR